MENRNVNIEDLFRQSFDGYKLEPSKNLWNKINFRLGLKQFFKADFHNFNVYYSAIIIGLVTGLLMYFTPSDSPDIIDKNINKSNLVINQANNAEPTKDKNISQLNNTKEYRTINQKLSSNSQPIISQQILYFEDEDCTSIAPIKMQRFNPSLLNEKDSLNFVGNIIPLKPRPLFTIDCKEGCVPFELNLKNYSKGADKFYWTFGDGGSSKDKSPTYTYNYPGIYKIQMKAVGIGGTAISIIDSIIVHDKPTVKVHWPYETEFLVGEKIVIPVESQNSKRFEWDFGDGSLIYKKQVEYSYKSTGQYSISLRSWSEFNCMDSVKVADIKVIKNENRIVFPTAFCPSPDGPSDGRYSERENVYDIFHPVAYGMVVEYKLVVYSRLGSVLFQSNNINTGWDGYYDQKMMPEGVYPYVVTAKFEGSAPIMKKGNVTILHRK